MKRLRIKYLWLMLLIFMFINLNQYCFGQRPLPKRLRREKKNYLEKQLSFEEKLFLDQLSIALKELAKSNEAALKTFFSLRSENDVGLDIIVNEIKKPAKYGYLLMKGRKNHRKNIPVFVRDFFKEDKILITALKNLIKKYEQILNIKKAANDSSQGTLISGSYRYYELLKESFSRSPLTSPENCLRYEIKKYQAFSRLAQDHNIERLKDLLPEDIMCLMQTNHNLKDILKEIKISNATWGKSTILEILGLIDKQLIFNTLFLQAVNEKIKSIDTPIEPTLPDLKVSSIDIVIPKEIKVGQKITLKAGIKNSGDLRVRSSVMQITFPDGSTRRKRIKSLRSGEIQEVKFRYRLPKDGTNTFKILANYNNKTFESSSTNNELTRNLIVLAEE